MRAEGEATEWQQLITDGSEMGAFIRAHDWSQTPLGSVATWFHSLKTALSILLNACSPMFLVWGRERILFYNDAYSSILQQSNHPLWFGQSISDRWREEWDSIRSDLEQVWTTGQPFRRENQSFPRNGNGNSGEHSYSWSYSAIWDETGQVGGVFVTGCRVITEEKKGHTDISERRPSETLYRILSEAVPDFIWACDENGQVDFVNPRWIEYTGLTLEELNAGGLAQVNHPEDFPQLMNQWQIAAQKGEPFEAEFRYRRKDGEYRWFIGRAVPIKDANGRITQWIGTTTDIHDRKQAQQQLQQTLQTLQTLITASPLPIVVIEPDECVVQLWNPSAEKLFGWSEAEVLGNPIPIVPEEKQQECCQLREAVVKGEIFSGIETYRCKHDGSRVSASISAASFKNESGSTIGIVLIFQDITERQQAEEALRQSEEQARLAIMVGRLGTWRYNPGTDLVTLDERMREIWGVADDAVALPLPMVVERIHPDDRARVVSAISAALDPKSSGTYEIDYRIVWEDGTERWILANGQVQFEGEAESLQPVGFLGTALDITDRKQAEAALRQSEERLRLAMEGAQMGTWDVDLITGKAIWSEEHFTMLGYEPVATGEATEEMWSRRIHPDDLERVVQAWHQSQQEHRLYRAEYRVVRADNEQIAWLAGLGSFTYDQTGQAIRSIGVLFDITDRKQAEAEREQLLQALTAERAQFEAVLRQMPAGVIIAQAPSGKLLLGNQQAEQIWRHPFLCAIEIGEYNEYKGFHADGRVYEPQEWPLARSIITGEIVPQEEIRFLRGDGTSGVMEASSTPIYDPQGQIIAGVVIFQDITDRKQAEIALCQVQENLRIANERFELAASAVNCLIYDWHLEGDRVERTEGLTRILGYSLAEAQPTGQWWRERVHPDDLQHLLEEAATTLKTHDRQSYEYRVRNKDNQYIYVLDQGLVVSRDAEGNPTRIVGSTTDISDRKQAEVALRQSEERYRYLAESIPQLVWTANAQGGLLDVNQRWLDFTGLTLSQVQIEGWQAVVYPDDISILSQRWASAQQNGTAYQAEGRMRRVDGVYRWHLHQAVPLKNERGQVIKWFGTATDIEDQKQLDQQRDRILQQEQAAREEAEKANRIKDEFLAILSHELRSPLNPILGWTKLLQTRKFDELTTKRALETIERNAKLQTQLIEDLLDVSRILRGKMVLNVAPVDLVTVIEAALETVRLSAEAKGIQIQKHLVTNVGLISGDASRFQQIIWNLLSNAIKFTPSGGQVEIRLERVEGKAQIQVRDTGKGIRPEFLPHVFEYFRQEDGSTTRTFGGLGLGLAIVRHLTELHGGTVDVASPGEGFGATFTIQLPLMTLSCKPARREPGNSSLLAPDSLPLAGVKLLIVDDKADMRELLVTILEQSGAIVSAAASAAEALSILEQTKPTVLISDIGMPEMDGYRLMRQVRQRLSQQEGQILAIALTAYAGELDQKQALSAGFQTHLAKPIEPEELVRAIVSLVKPVL